MAEHGEGFEATGGLAKVMAEIKLAHGLEPFSQVGELAVGTFAQIVKGYEDGEFIVAVQEGNPATKVLNADLLVNARARKLRGQIRLLKKD